MNDQRPDNELESIMLRAQAGAVASEQVASLLIRSDLVALVDGEAGAASIKPFFYDRGWGGFSVDYGSRSVSLLKLTDVHFDHGRVRVGKAVDDVLTAARLRIPDKFLAAHGWSAQQPPTESSTEGDV
ncbi:MAG: hypothetical protein IJO71_00125 [Microbacterium sp.]|uniref:hypothetical protein n=1 Tax=Microbacterium sp. TaxID=51671 RepID=UPI0025D0C6E1|nr:hypothetical protein [Microbacterium sp.]MBQ9915593.1 hypothetical protein [Microbacterium sp.]